MTIKDFHHPFQPYDIQQQFMEALYACIDDGKVGIFESPTGTGKSLSLICASLTWLREHKRRSYDESLAAIAVDDDEPEWMLEHAKMAKRQEMQQIRADLEARLSAIQQKEKTIRERQTNGAPVLKRRKVEADDDFIDEEQFLLDEYHEDQSPSTSNSDKNVNSVKTTILLEQLGILPSHRSEDVDSLHDETKIYLCSRTHSQLSQLVGELRRLKLPPGLPSEPILNSEGDSQDVESLKQISLGSRKNLCINPKVSRLGELSAINERCMELQQSSTAKQHRCSFLPSTDREGSLLDFRDHALAKPRDIEDLVKLGTRLELCPYYAARPAIRPAEVVTLPYPLLLQQSAREALGLSLKGHVVIIDEAHNLMNALEGINSTQISQIQLKRAKDCLIVYVQKFRNRLKGSNRVYLAQLVRVIDSLLMAVTDINAYSETSGSIEPTDLLSGKGVDQVNLPRLVQYISESKLARKVDGYASHVAEKAYMQNTDGGKQADRALGTPTLFQVQTFLASLTNPGKHGRFFWDKSTDSCTIRYLLLDPSTHFRDIVQEARAVILAGGTMSPMDEYQQRLFPYLADLRTFSCGHLIPTSNLFVRTITSDALGRLNFDFKSRTLESTADRVGTVLEHLSRNVRGGLVVFFPSYGFLDQIRSRWKSSGMLTRLEQLHPTFLDNRTEPAETTFKAYSDAIASHPSHSAMLASVLGGKLSEGINFSDELGRCVVVVGLPFPNLDTSEWKAKLKYIDDTAVARGVPNGKASKELVENTCMRSVNQAIGRVIRHKDDWAGIILMDGRYEQQRIKDKLPGWIKACLPKENRGTSYTSTGAVQDIGSFFDGKHTMKLTVHQSIAYGQHS
nr:atp-dependent dna helicase chl1 [Quercus suber]